MILIICIAWAFAAIVCYAAVCAGAQADIQSQRYWEEHKHEFYGYDKFKQHKEKEGEQ